MRSWTWLQRTFWFGALGGTNYAIYFALQYVSDYALWRGIIVTLLSASVPLLALLVFMVTCPLEHLHTAVSDEMDKHVAVLVIVHCTPEKVLRQSLALIKVHFNASAIYVCDNGSQSSWNDTKTFTISTDAGVNYLWHPYGNKNMAQMCGARAAANHGFTHFLTLDDDTYLPSHFRTHLSEATGLGYQCIMYLNRAVNRNTAVQQGLLVGFQDMEYKLLHDCNRRFVYLFCGSFPQAHGSIQLWDIKLYMKLIAEHDWILNAEDQQFGWLCLKYGDKIFCAQEFIGEGAPDQVIGCNAYTLWHQRVKGWETINVRYARALVTFSATISPPAMTNWGVGWRIFSWLVWKLTWWAKPLSVAAFFIQFGTIATLAMRIPSMWFGIGLLLAPTSIIIQILCFITCYTRRRPQERPNVAVACLFPVYVVLYTIYQMWSILWFFWVYFPEEPCRPRTKFIDFDMQICAHPSDLKPHSDSSRSTFVVCPASCPVNQTPIVEEHEVITIVT